MKYIFKTSLTSGIIQIFYVKDTKNRQTQALLSHAEIQITLLSEV